MAAIAGGVTHVGNGGSGILLEDHVYLFDLHEAGLSKSAFVGSKIFPAFETSPTRKILNPFEGPNRLLSRKISDIEGWYPGMGKILVDAIGYYKWRFKSELVGRTADRPLDFLTVQVAARMTDEIWIDLRYWNQMNELHRAALVIHEAVSSLKMQLRRGAASREEAAAVRKIVAQLFVSGTHELEALKSLHQPGELCSRREDIGSVGPHFHLSFSDDNKSNMAPRIRNACETASETTTLKVVAFRKPYYLKSFYRNFQILIFARPGTLLIDWDVKDKKDCFTSLLGIIEDWYSSDKYNSGPDCVMRIP